MSEVKLIGVRVTPTNRGTCKDEFTVWPEYSGVDRPITHGVEVHKKHLARICAAILSGKGYPIKGVLTDVDGKTYVDTEYNLMGKYMESSLRKLGF